MDGGNEKKVKCIYLTEVKLREKWENTHSRSRLTAAVGAAYLGQNLEVFPPTTNATIAL